MDNPVLLKADVLRERIPLNVLSAFRLAFFEWRDDGEAISFLRKNKTLVVFIEEYQISLENIKDFFITKTALDKIYLADAYRGYILLHKERLPAL